MSLKKLLGLEAFPLTEEEIVQKIQQAYSQNHKVIEFSSKAKKVVVKVADCAAGVYDWHLESG